MSPRGEQGPQAPYALCGRGGESTRLHCNHRLLGDRLFWDAERKVATPAAADGVFLGLAAANAPATAPRARVILNFGQSGVGGAGAASVTDYEWQTI